MSTLCNFLKKDYPSHFRTTWDDNTMQIRKECPASVVFEIRDQQPTIVQSTGKGVSVIRKKDYSVEIVDFEAYCKTIHGKDNIPSCCDFIISASSPNDGKKYIVLNELTNTESKYILPFAQSATGAQQIGKLAYAKRQLEATIERIYEVGNVLDSYDKKVALFSCRLSDKKGVHPMTKSARQFSLPIMKLEKMRLHETLPHGFEFVMRVYNKEYEL